MPIIPKYLREISPPLRDFHTKGKNLEEDFWGVAIIGTRRATSLGSNLAENIAYELARRNIPIISGMALGIDTAAHRGALRANGRTVAILGNGTDIIYPMQNKPLYDEILRNDGTIVSEYKDSTRPTRYSFTHRNRIVAGLSRAIIVIEAPIKSGAINTANHAANFGRDVFVFPGPYNHPNYAGSHSLIRDGARLISSIDDILADLEINTLFPKNTEKNIFNNEEEIRIYKAIIANGEPMTVDKIISITKLEPQKVMINLAKMTVCGIIIETGGKFTKK